MLLDANRGCRMIWLTPRKLLETCVPDAGDDVDGSDFHSTADLNLTKSGAAQPTRLSYHIDDGIDKLGLQEAGNLKIFQSKVLQNSLIKEN